MYTNYSIRLQDKVVITNTLKEDISSILDIFSNKDISRTYSTYIGIEIDYLTCLSLLLQEQVDTIVVLDIFSIY